MDYNITADDVIEFVVDNTETTTPIRILKFSKNVIVFNNFQQQVKNVEAYF